VPPFLPMVQRLEGEAGDGVFVFPSLYFRNPFLLFSLFTLLSFNFSKVPLLSFLLSFLLLCFSPLLFLSHFLSSYPLTVAFFVSKLPSPFSFKRSLSLVQNSTSRPSHPPSPAAGIESSIYRLEGRGLLLRVGSRGAACCCAWRAGHAAVGRPDKGRGALGSATVPCFKGRGALGSVWREREMNSVPFLFYFILFLFYLWGPKNGLQQEILLCEHCLRAVQILLHESYQQVGEILLFCEHRQ